MNMIQSRICPTTLLAASGPILAGLVACGSPQDSTAQDASSTGPATTVAPSGDVNTSVPGAGLPGATSPGATSLPAPGATQDTASTPTPGATSAPMSFGTGNPTVGTPAGSGSAVGMPGGMMAPAGSATTPPGGTTTPPGGMGGAGGAVGSSGGAGPMGQPPMGGAAPTGSGGAPAGVDGDFAIQAQLASELDNAAPPTVAIVTWSLAGATVTEAHIDFGLDTDYGMTAPVDLSQMDNRTALIGMKPSSDYHFRIVASDGAQTYTSSDQTVTTGAANGAPTISGFMASDASKVDKGFFITSYWQMGQSQYAFIIDTDGDVVWWYREPNGMDGISRARMSADGKSIWMVNESLTGAPLQRVSIDGLDSQVYTNTNASHDIAAVTGETMAYLDYSESDCNSIFEIDNSGTTKEVFESTGVTNDVAAGAGGGGLGLLMQCHGNSVRYSAAADSYVFSDWQQAVGIVKRSDGSATTISSGQWGGAQHGTQLLGDSLLVFANNGAGAMNQSQAFEVDLSGNKLHSYPSQGGSTNFGDVQRLPSGNTLITYSTDRLVTEVDSNDNTVLSFQGSGAFGYVEFRPDLYGPPIDTQ